MGKLHHDSRLLTDKTLIYANLALMSGVRLSFSIVAAYAAATFFVVGIEKLDWIAFTQHFMSAASLWLAMLGAAAVLLSVREVRKGDEGLRPWELARTINWPDLVWPPFLYAGLLGTFGVFKQRALIDAPFRFDHAFSDFDRAIFGTDPWRLSHPSAGLTEFFGTAYYGWYAPMMMGILACAFLVRWPYFRDRYIVAFVLTWILVGSVMAYLLPAAGPCYWDVFVGGPNPYVELMDQLSVDVAVSYDPVLDAQAYLLKAYGGSTVFGGGISAMPSMHVAAATLFACGAWKVSRVLGLAFAAFGGVIWWASVHLGWHYFVDGLVAIPATLTIWWLCGKLYPETAPETYGKLVPAG